jgi:hypothetical protein
MAELTYTLAPDDTLWLDLTADAFGFATQVPEPPPLLLLAPGLLALKAGRRWPAAPGQRAAAP